MLGAARQLSYIGSSDCHEDAAPPLVCHVLWGLLHRLYYLAVRPPAVDDVRSYFFVACCCSRDGWFPAGLERLWAVWPAGAARAPCLGEQWRVGIQVAARSPSVGCICLETAWVAVAARPPSLGVAFSAGPALPPSFRAQRCASIQVAALPSSVGYRCVQGTRSTEAAWPPTLGEQGSFWMQVAALEPTAVCTRRRVRNAVALDGLILSRVFIGNSYWWCGAILLQSLVWESRGLAALPLVVRRGFYFLLFSQALTRG